ncbi:NAD(P)-binding domain-containing protein [Yinghuangia sp. YIM S09857]|uniref:NAD(P)-binding domain-containing protein n=1 Tax=Yinghuangia sp. YIM S09857 TaxID=3436929 RepID=UPI003F53AB53
MKIAVVGLGQIGGGVAGALASAGHHVTVYDVRPEAAEPFTAKGAVIASGLADAARGQEVVVVAVVDDAQLRAVAAEALPAMPPGAAMLVLSTVSVATLDAVTAEAGPVKVDVVDCGVTGGPKAAARGRLVSMLGGDEATVARIMPVVNAFSSKAVRLGERGAGLRAKIVRNMMQYNMWAVAHEAQMLAEAADLDLVALREVIDAGDVHTGGPLGLFGTRADGGNMRARQVGAALAHKDMRAAVELAERLGADVPLTRAIEPGYDDVLGAAPVAADGTGETVGEDARTAGLRVMAELYNLPSYADAPRTPYLDLTVEHLFGTIWTRPGLDMRQRRLLVIGALVALGRDDLVETQFSSALDRGELTIEQLREIVIHLAHYVGWPQTTVIGPMVERLAHRRGGNKPTTADA